MTQTKTKKALLMSVLSMVLCVAMLVGMTFAWFTDTASTAVNKIESGKLDVMLLGADDKKLSKETPLTWVTEDEGDVLWEPNCTYNLNGFKIKNAGNLALKYKVVLKATNITENDGKTLLDVIDWTIKIGNETLTVTSEQIKNGLKDGIEIIKDRSLAKDTIDNLITVTGHMRSDAGNDYQGLSIAGFGIAVYATQDTVEYDSTGNTYDEAADYDKTDFLFVDSVDSLKAAAENAKPGDEIKLTDDITLSETIVFDASGITFNGNGHTIKADMSDEDVENLATLLRFGHDTTYCTGVTVKDVTFAGKGGRAMHFHGGTSSVLENVKISGEWSLAINFYGTHGAVMNNCDISSTYANKYAKSSIFANEQSANQIILNNTKIDDLFVNATANGATYANGGIKVVVNSGSTINKLHTNAGITRTFHEVNGGTVGEVLADC